LANGGGLQKILQMQLFLRRRHMKSPLDGKVSKAFKAAVIACLHNEPCRMGASGDN
jgi:hypothetical protein